MDVPGWWVPSPENVVFQIRGLVLAVWTWRCLRRAWISDGAGTAIGVGDVNGNVKME
jgi:hypothetical protein